MSLPAALVPQSARELAEMVRESSARGQAVSTSRCPRRGELRIDLSALNAIEQYEPGDLTVRVQAGARVRMLLDALGQHRQMLPLDVPNLERATVGGAMAAAAHGPMRAGFGGIREYCIGIEFVTADGTLARAGGMVVKNVAGYDLMKLLIGSRGTLGIITSANFKVFPMAPRTATFGAEFSSSAEATEFARGVRRSALSPMRMEIVSPGALAGVKHWSIFVTAAGTERVLERYRQELRSGGMRDLLQLSREEESALWSAMNGIYSGAFVGSAAGLVVEVSATLTGVERACRALEETAERFAAEVYIHGRVGTGNLIAIYRLGEGSPIDDVIVDLQRAIRRDAFLQVLHPHGPLDIAGNPAMKLVKQALDPGNMLNPGAVVF